MGSSGIESVQKTKHALDILKKVGCEEELQRVLDSKKVRAGKGKMRNRRYVMRRGPLVVYNEDNGIVRAMRNIPGVETACVDRLNLLKLAPGGNFGRFIIWTGGAFEKLNAIYGELGANAPLKKGYHLPRAQMENADVSRIINSDEVQSVLRPKLEAPKKFAVKKNPLKNPMVMARLNPGVMKKKELRKRSHEKASEEGKLVQGKKKARLTASKAHNKEHKRGEETFYKTLMKAFTDKAAEANKGEGDAQAEEEE